MNFWRDKVVFTPAYWALLSALLCLALTGHARIAVVVLLVAPFVVDVVASIAGYGRGEVP